MFKGKRVKEIKKDSDGKLWVRWVNGKKFFKIPEDKIARYLVYLIAYNA